MVSWQERPSEVSYLLNPAFCGRIIYNTISEYYSSSEKRKRKILLRYS